MGHLASEIDKLAAALGSERAVGPDEVARLVGVQPGETVEDWVSAVLARDLRRALRLTDVVLPQAGVTGVRMVMTLGTDLVGLRLARALADGGHTGVRVERALLAELRKTRPPGGRDWSTQARSWSVAVRRWGAAELDRAIAAAYAADRALKSTTLGDDSDVLRTLVLSLGVQEAAA